MAGENGRTTDGDLSTRLIEGLAQEAQPLPQSVELGRVRALRREQVIKLVRDLTAEEAKRLALIEARLRDREREWQSRVTALEVEVTKLQETNRELEVGNEQLVASRDSTTRYELPRLANLVDQERQRAEEERTRADQLEQEMLLLEERIEELELELERARGDAPAEERGDSDGIDRVAVLQEHVARLQAQLAERGDDLGPPAGEPDAQKALLEQLVERLKGQLAEREGELEELRAYLAGDGTPEEVGTRELLEQALEEYALAEERSARLTALEEVVWELERGNETSGAWRRALDDLRERYQAEQEQKRETGAQLRVALQKEQQLEQQVSELRQSQEQSRLEIATLMARHESASAALDEAQDELAQARAQLEAAGGERERAHTAWEEAEEARAQAEQELAQAKARAADADARVQAQEAAAPAEDAEGDEADRLRRELAAAQEARSRAEEELATADEALQAAELELIHTKRSLSQAEKGQEESDTARRRAEFDATAQATEVERLRKLLEEAHGQELQRTLDEAASFMEGDESDGSTPKLPGEVLDLDTYNALKEELEDERDRADALAQDLETAQLLLAQNTETLECELAAVRGALAEAQARGGAPAPAGDDADVSVVRRAYRDARDEADRLELEAASLRRALAESRAAEAALSWRQDALEEALESRLRAAESVYQELQEQRPSDGLRATLDESQAELAQLRAALAQSREEVEALQSLLESAPAAEPDALARHLQQELDEVRATLARVLDERDAEASTAIENLQSALASVALDRDEVAQGLTPDADAAHEALQSSQEALQRLEADLESARQALLKEQEGAEAGDPEAEETDEVEGLRAELAATRSELAEREARLADVELELAVVRGTLQGAEDAARALRERLKQTSELESELEAVRHTSRLLEGELEVARTVLAERDTSLAEAEREREALTQRLAAVTEEPSAPGSGRVLRIHVPDEDEEGDEALILDEAPPQETLVERLELPATEGEGPDDLEALRRETVALRLELARSQASRESLEEQLHELAAKANEQTPSPPYAPEELAALRVRAESAEEEQGRLEAEIHDLERLLESETWRGLATHRDLVRAHQRLRQVEQELASATARAIELEAAAERAAELEEVVPELEGRLEAARARGQDVAAREAFSAAFDHEPGAEVSEEDRQEAIRWLLSTSPAQQEFLKTEADELLPDLTRRETDTRRLLRVAREDFQAQRKNLLEEVLTTERAIDHAESVGVKPEELSRKSKRATERLRTFDSHLEIELRNLEEQLQDDQDNRYWLMWELGGGPSPRSEEVPGPRVPAHVEAQLVDLRKRFSDETERRHETEREAMQALQEAERERARLEQELRAAQQELERAQMRDDAEASAAAANRLRLEEQVRDLQSALDVAPRAVTGSILDDPTYVRQAERLALLSCQMEEKDSIVHWLLKELDPEFQSTRALLAQDCADAVEGLATDGENGNGERRADLLHWLIVEGDRVGKG